MRIKRQVTGWIILIAALLYISCKEQVRTSTDDRTTSFMLKEYDSKTETVITGHITNREVYPLQKNMILKLPGYGSSFTKKNAEIDEDGFFIFRFLLYGARDVAIETFIPYLIVRPGDSLHIEIDFKHFTNIRFSGSAGKINNDLFAFTDKGYYVEPYSGGAHFEWSGTGFKDEVRLMRKEMEERKKAYLKNHTPEPEVLEWINQTLDIDYYQVMMAYPWLSAMKKGKQPVMNQEWYANLISQVEKLYDKQVTNSKLYGLTSVYWVYLNRILQQEDPQLMKLSQVRSYIERILVSVKNPVLRQHLMAKMFNHLLNNPVEFQKNLDLLNTYLTLPELKYPLLEAYQIKCKNAYAHP